MRIELRGETVRFYKDVATDRSCGESRSDWELIGWCYTNKLVNALERLVKQESKVEFI